MRQVWECCSLKAIMISPPLIQSLRALRWSKDSAVCIAYAVFAAIFIFLACLPFSAAVQNMQVRKFHFALRPFAVWAADQFVPSMYNFHNRLVISYAPLHELDAAAELAPVRIITVNHYPLHLMYTDRDRQRLMAEKPLYLYALSNYRGREWMTPCVLTCEANVIHIQIGTTDEPPVR